MSSELKDAILDAAKLMAISARTAPKTKGLDDIEIAVLSSEDDLKRLAEEMERIGSETGRSFFLRDAENIRMTPVVLLIGVKASKPKNLDCGGCGHRTCAEFMKAERSMGKDLSGPSCIFQLLDLGIALGSAVKTASILNIDNRIMFSAGAAAKNLGYLESDIVLAIPLSATGKNIYFDRRWRRK